MPWKRKDADGNIEIVQDFEGHVDRVIREARDAGLFDNLKGHGQPLNLDENPFAGEWNAAYRMVANAGATLPWIELNNEIIKMQEEREKLLQRAEKAAQTMKAARLNNPGKMQWYRTERARQKEAYLKYTRSINTEIERFNLMCPVHSLAKPTLQIKFESERFDQAWPVSGN